MRAVSSAVTEVRQTHHEYQRRGLTDHARIWNVALYLLLLEGDILQLKHDAIDAMTDYRRGFIARMMAVQLYEAYQDVPRLLGKDFRVGLKELGFGPGTLENLNVRMKRLASAKNEHQALLKRTRNTAGAHRAKDAVEQWTTVDEADLAVMLRVSGDLYAVLRDLVPLVKQIGARAGDPAVIFKWYAAHPDATLFPAETGSTNTP